MMQKFDLYDYLDASGKNDFKDWTTSLQKGQRGKLNAKIDTLAMNGDGLMPHMLTDTPTPGIKKLRVHGNVQLRPLLCKGPINIHQEYTFLLGAIEVGSKFEPKLSDRTAEKRKQDILKNPKQRCNHERVT